jgi:acyl-CoA synthetase (AMP-forming)/AMP-acid ligase II
MIYWRINKVNVRERPSVDPDSIATLIMTSGTTGKTEKEIYSICF